MYESKSVRRRLPVPRLAVALAFLLSLALAAVTPQLSLAQNPTETDASVRFVHASPDAPAVDVIVDGAVVASDLAFGQATDALSVSPDEHQLQIVPTGQDASSAVVDTTLDPDSGTTYIVAVSGLLKDIEAKVYDVHKDDLDTGQSRLRLINLSPEDTSVDFYVTGGDELFDDLDFGTASDYTDLDTGSYDFEVRPHDQETASLSIPGFEVGDGNAYDLLLIGAAADNTLSVVPLTTPVSTPCSTVLGSGTPGDACVRVIHASPDAPAVDIYVNGSKVVENLAYGAGTDFAPLPSGDDREIQIVPTGSSVDDAIFDTTVDLGPGKAYDVVAVGMADDIDAIVENVDLSAIPEGQARVRVMHAAPDVDGVDVVVTDGPELFTGVEFKDTTDYQVIDAGTYDIQVKQGDDVLIRVQDLTLEAGQVYDILAIGRSDDGSLQLVAFSAPAESPTGMAATPDMASTPMTVEEATPAIEATPAG
ncbi:MAG TPA: DUF4397 domain-containing protein [Thermomicrobiales bacterium]|nr:DUF4397 domain-containing protein [Thermomicrobiales bacterium]